MKISFPKHNKISIDIPNSLCRMNATYRILEKRSSYIDIYGINIYVTNTSI